MIQSRRVRWMRHTIPTGQTKTIHTRVWLKKQKEREPSKDLGPHWKNKRKRIIGYEPNSFGSE
jgi:hypothetical protein